jgi:cell division protein FtsN
VGPFRDPANAARLAARLEAAAHRVTVEPSAWDASLWIVRIGGYRDRAQAEAVRAQLQRQGLAGLLVSTRPEREHDDASRHALVSAGE